MIRRMPPPAAPRPRPDAELLIEHINLLKEERLPEKDCKNPAP